MNTMKSHCLVAHLLKRQIMLLSYFSPIPLPKGETEYMNTDNNCTSLKFSFQEDVTMKRKLWQELNDQQAEKLSGGMNKVELVDEVDRARQPEAEGKIRGTLILP